MKKMLSGFISSTPRLCLGGKGRKAKRQNRVGWVWLIQRAANPYFEAKGGHFADFVPYLYLIFITN